MRRILISGADSKLRTRLTPLILADGWHHVGQYCFRRKSPLTETQILDLVTTISQSSRAKIVVESLYEKGDNTYIDTDVDIVLEVALAPP